MAPLVVTLVRHGESKDNLTSLWAGHRDAPLSNHGWAQSLRLAQHFENVPITAIYTSDLSRAQTTGRNVLEANKSQPPPPFTISPLLREQFFGSAEGAPWNEGLYSSTHLPWEDHRKFQLAPHAESLDDVGARADKVLRNFILPHLKASAESNESEHIVLFAHGIWLSEMMFSLQRAQDPLARFVKNSRYLNTAWARVELTLVPDGAPLEPLARDVIRTAAPASTKSLYDTFPPLSEDVKALYPTLPDVPDRHATLPPAWPEDAPTPRIRVKSVAANQAEHLVGLERTKGGVGSGAWDEKQRKLENFFGGGGAMTQAKAEKNEEEVEKTEG